MPPIDPSQIAAPNPTPQPFPGAAGLPSFPQTADPMKQQTQQNQNIRTGLDINSDARAAAQLEMERERLRIAKEQADLKKRSIDANAGMDTTASQDKAANHVIALDTEFRILDDVKAHDPNALRPSWGEKIVGTMTNDPDYLSFAKNEQRQRASAAYRNIIESALYLKTGAAYNQEQLEGQIQALTPQINDSPMTLKDKETRLRSIIESATAEAGPSNAKVEQAMERLKSYLPEMYAPVARNSNDAGGFSLSGTKETVPVPPEMQADYESFLKTKPQGSLTVGDYVSMRKALDRKYGFGEGDYPDAQRFVDAYNAGRANLRIPGAEKDLGALGRAAASAAADEGVVGDVYTGAMNAANAGGFGLPSLLANREDRFAKGLADEAHPDSATVGDIAGSIAPTVALERLGAKAGLGAIGREVAGNAAYAAARGANEAEPGDRLVAGGLGALEGGAASLAARGAVRGARGFLGPETQAAIDDVLEPKTFTIPGERGALPVDDITPARMQTMSDAELANERRLAEQGITANETLAAKATANATERQAIEAEAKRVAADNVRKQEQYVRENFRSTNPEGIQAIRETAEKQFPTDPAEVLQQPEFAPRLGKLRDPDPTGLPDKALLEQRIARIDEHLGKSAEPKTGTIPGTDLTTMQRGGMTAIEEAGQGLPAVSSAREKALESQNLQNSARVLARVGKELPKDIRAGQDANAYVNTQLNDVYNRLRPQIKGKADNGFNSAIAALRKQATDAGPEQKELWTKIEEQLQKFRNPDGTFNGQGYREASTGLRELTDFWQTAKSTGSSIEAGDMARIAEQARRQMQALVARANPAVGKQLKAVEGAWAHQARIELASRGAAKATRGVYSPDEYLSAIERSDTSRNKAAVARGKAFDQPYAQNAREVLGGKPAKRASMRETAIGGAMIGLGGGLVTAAATLAGAGYAPGVKRLAQAIVEGKVGTSADKLAKYVAGNGDSKTREWLSKGSNADALQRLVTQYLRTKAQ